MNAEAVPDNSFAACPVCGHPAQGGEHRCQKCGRRLGAGSPSSKTETRDGLPQGKLRVVEPAAGAAPKGPTAKRPRAPAFPEPLRRQLSERVRQFRTRRLHPSLPFPPGRESAEESAETAGVVPIAAPEAPPIREPAGRTEEHRLRTPRPRVQAQNPLAFPDAASGLQHLEFSTPPVASFRIRVLADCLDFACILAAIGLFLAPLPLLAVQVVLNRYVMAAGVAAGCAVALLYGAVFLYWAGATPAMRHMGLRLVNFDGQPASRPERLWRLLGSIASAGSFFLGFLWAAMDDEKFSWHDRISRTFLTTLAPDDR